jgi:PhzF family phenazine biosynthesis protein
MTPQHHKLFVVDAFCKTPYSGNPAGVLIFPVNSLILSDTSMQLIAREMSLSETAFAVQLESNRFLLRWFSPTTEVPLCGHATLATASVIFQHYSHLLDGNAEIIFDTKYRGTLKVSRDVENKALLSMDFPQGKPNPITLRKESLEALSMAMGFPVSSVIDIQLCPMTLKLLVVLNDKEVILKKMDHVDFQAMLKVDFKALSSEVRGVIVTARGDQDNQDFDCISRYFSPWNGINEDPVTGSAHVVLAVYWGKLMKKKILSCFQASPRKGELICELLDDKDRVLLKGSAVLVLQGEIQLP